MSAASDLADKFERGEMEINSKDGGKRSKAEQAEHMHQHPEGETRKFVQTAMKGEEKRKNEEKLKQEKDQKK